MVRSLKNKIKDNHWKKLDSFNGVIVAIEKCGEGDEQNLQAAKIQRFLKTVLLMINTFFSKWATENLYVGLFSVSPIAEAVAHIYLGLPYTKTLCFKVVNITNSLM